MLGALKRPVLLRAEINVSLVALAVAAVASRLRGLASPRAVV